jgi:(p)ppGpp synthase/HD superfamily hydrolase
MKDDEISTYQEKIRVAIKSLAHQVLQLAQNAATNPTMSFRVKDLETLKKKMALKNIQDVFSIDDVYGIRILVESVHDAYSVLGKISHAFPGFLDHDYIINPKINSEKEELRLLQYIAYKNEIPFEIQITTHDFNTLNELCHEKYHAKRYGHDKQ